ncbi:TMV resistance protein N-like isoform X3 [Arachis ipaensis]|uniref:TMV resistance protein N-like isoform X3 n=1 Tax=Arachis ipaensis TaxID=130454 RepID=UPI0007AF8A4F|nr:TMV resistance protein N-like isoform X3 [Arachis ipaensis]XP_029149476.1 TMV resistance protein N isoform X2 [Arachis hypogaea]
MSGGSTSLSCSFSSFSYGWTYDVFISFRGTDTRHGFTGHLYSALSHRGIRTFIDDQDLQRGHEITPSLLKAIQESRIAILVFSANYASSSFCLDELATIINCVKSKGRLVLPVFYGVDPSDVRHQRGTYGEALATHEERFKDNLDIVHNWRNALHQAANLSGWHFKQGDEYEYKFIGKIVEVVSRNIRRGVLPVADYPVGLESKVVQVNSLLEVGSNDGVRMIGIHGIGGIGKTTLALAVYNCIADHFEGLCFLQRVRESSSKHGLVHLQNILLSELLGENKFKSTSVQQGISIIHHRLQRKKILLILDDVDRQEQLQALAGNPDWFGPGSRVIITTRDTHLLACHGVERSYELEGLNYADAVELLSWKAFKTIDVSPSYVDVLNHAVTYAHGLPLALEVIGSNMFGKSIGEWKSAINQYERIPNKNIHEILKVSFDALEEEEQSVFLDIACCFRGYALAEVEDILHAHHGACMKYHIGVLVEKSLIKIQELGEITLHDLIEHMGKELVRQESPKVLGKRSRLWWHEDIVQVLEDNQGTSEIEIIHLNFPSTEDEEEEKVEWDGKAFKKMKNLKTLIIKNGHFSEGPTHFPNSLRVLEWWRYPSECLPSNFHPKKLSIFKLPNSCFLSLYLASLLKATKFATLKVLNFDNNKYLTQLPDISGLPNLQKLSFEHCENLISVHNSVGFLKQLKSLSAYRCGKLTSFPCINLPSLEELRLSGCSSLENFPEILEKMEKITGLHLEHTGIKALPLSFQKFSRLQQLTLNENKYCKIPSAIVMMPELVMITVTPLENERLSIEGEETVSSMVSSNVEYLSISRCNLSDDFFPLDLRGNDFTFLPECIKECHFLRKLSVDYCPNLKEIRGIPPNLEHFSAIGCKSWTSSCTSMLTNQELHEAGNTRFALPGSRIPAWFEHHSKGASISFWFRNKFPAIALFLAIGLTDKNTVFVSPDITINGKKGFPEFWTEMEQIFLFDLQMIQCDLGETLSENEWNHAEISCTASDHFLFIGEKFPVEPFAKEIGIHVFRQKSTVEDIRFTDPYKRRKLDEGLCSSDP